MTHPFYNPTLTYEENFKNGPPLSSLKITYPKRNITKTTKFLGFDINIPFGMPAGPLLNSEYVKEAFARGFDVNCYKTQRSHIVPSNEFPNVLFVDIDGDLTLEKAERPFVGTLTTDQIREKFSITNSFGNPSKGPAFWQEDMKKALSYAAPGQLLIGSVCGTLEENMSEEAYFEDFAVAAKMAADTGVKVAELNLSCPNAANEGVVCYTENAVLEICKRSKEKIGNTKLIAKIGYFSYSQQSLLESIVQKMSPFVSAISAINTIAAPIVNEKGKQALPGLNRLKSGICGASIKWAGIDMVKRLSKLREKLHANFEIVGVGGVMTPNDYFHYRTAGADLVQSATGAMWQPTLAYKIWKRENR